MRILFCNFEYPPLGGGGGVFSALLAQEMAKSHEVTVLTSQGLGLPRESIDGGVRIIRAQVYFRKREAVANLLSMVAFIPSGIKAGKELLKFQRYDVINTHFVLPTGPVGDFLSSFAEIPNVLSIHGGDLYEPTKFMSPHRHFLLRAWIKRLLRRADLVVGQSNNTLENMRRFYTPEIEGIRIPLGIQRPKVSASSRSRYGFTDGDTLLVTVGRLVPRKSIDQLISVIYSLKGIARLLIIGTGPQESSLKGLCLQKMLGERVIFMGNVSESEKFQILSICDLYVSTSQHEGFGLVFLEAMSCGLPIVCYDHGGQTDFLRDQETGYIVPLNSLDVFKERCQRLIMGKTLRKSIGENNKWRAEEFYIDRCAMKYEAVFQQVVKMNGKDKAHGFFR